jgi:hypothetical protein
MSHVGSASDRLPVSRFPAPPLEDEKTVVVQGTRVTHHVQGEDVESCRYSVSISVPPGVPALEQHEVKNTRTPAR